MYPKIVQAEDVRKETTGVPTINELDHRQILSQASTYIATSRNPRDFANCSESKRWSLQVVAGQKKLAAEHI
jgi:hypothetical protein